MESWTNIWMSESEEGHFDFVNHDEEQRIELHKMTEDGRVIATLNMDYSEWKDLCQFIKRIGN